MKKKEMADVIRDLRDRVAALEAIVNLFPRVVPAPAKEPDRAWPPYVLREPAIPTRIYSAVIPLTESESAEIKKFVERMNVTETAAQK